jgi:phosphomannomutase
MSYSNLQNGSDIRGIAMDNETGASVNLTNKASKDLAGAFAKWLSKRNDNKKVKIALGRDSRLTGEALLKAAAAGIIAQGHEVCDFGIASTPAMFMSTVLASDEDDAATFDGSIMITASHLPYYRNGLKFFTKEGGLEKGDIKELTELADKILAENPEKSVDVSSADIKSINFMDTYASYLQKKIRDGVGKGDKPLEGLHIIVDAGNGAGGFYVTKVLEPLGADTSGSQFLTPDGRFPNHIPNPENKEAAESIKKATLDSKADLGIIFDTDVDRAGAVLPSGKTLTRNDLIAVLSMIALSEHPGTTIVTDSVTSDGLHDFIEAHGGKHKRFKRGYRNVIDESIRLNNEGIDSQLAIETSGHGAFKENYFLDDGAYLMVKLLIEMGKGKKLEEMIKDLSEPCESDEIRFPVYADKIEGGDLQSNGDRILKMLEEAAGKVEGWSLPESNYEGVRVNTDKDHGDGWLLLRKSLHEPIMPLNIESNTKGGNLIMATKLKEILAGEDTLDQSPLDAFIGK